MPAVRSMAHPWLAALLLWTPACYLSHERPTDAGDPPDAWAPPDTGFDGGSDAGPVDAGFDGGSDAGPLDAGTDAPMMDAFVPGCDGSTVVVEAALSLDLLFLVDNSGSMSAEQVQLAAEFPSMVRSLVTGDVDDDGSTDFPPVRDLHVGVVTSDMGVGGNYVDSCESRHFGDDGVLRDRGRTTRECRRPFPRFLEFDVEAGDREDELVDDFACVGIVGTNGCGYEQQLEAVLKALTPSTSPTRFHGDTTGHGDGTNDGFLREDSILAVVLVTDEDDCSASDPSIFDLDDSRWNPRHVLRCSDHEAEALHPLDRYVDGLRALRPEHPERLMLGAIVGVPPDLAPDPEDIDYDAILDDPRMDVEPHPFWEGLHRPSCEVPGRGQAFPPRRIVRLAREMDDQSVVSSICAPSFSTTTAAVLSRLGRTIRTVGCDEEE